jgi:thymidylate synthase
LTYLAVPAGSYCAQTWLSATNLVDAQDGHEAHNVIMSVEDATSLTEEDRLIARELDKLLADHELSVSTVANTIFPQSLYERYGSPQFYDIYAEKIFPKIHGQADWGRYFERLIRFPLCQGKKDSINPLQNLISKMKEQIEGGHTFRNVYELTIYDPRRDAGRNMNRQCMSFLSFKLTEDHKLLLTAVYRNHYYMQRLLGNLVGLGRLQRFVAKEVGIGTGPLTVLSTHAEVDSVATRGQIAKTLASCAKIMELGETEVA